MAKVRRAGRSASAVRKPVRKVARSSVAKTRLKRRTPGKAGVKKGKAGAVVLRGSLRSHLRMTDRTKCPAKLTPKSKPKGKRTATRPKRMMSEPKPAPKRGGVVSVPKTYSTELLASGRHRYEHTDEPVAAIAADFRIHPGSLRRLGKRLGWVRFGFTPKQLPVAARLLRQAGELETAHEGAPASVNLEAIAGIETQVLKELAELEAVRAQLRGQPRRVRDGETTARTYSSLTETLQKLQRLRLGVAAAGEGQAPSDEFPENIDELRLELARRIDAFIESRFDTGVSEDTHAAPVCDVR